MVIVHRDCHPMVGDKKTKWFKTGWLDWWWSNIIKSNHQVSYFHPSIPNANLLEHGCQNLASDMTSLILLMPNIMHQPVCKKPVNNGINDQPQLVSLPDFWLPSTVVLAQNSGLKHALHQLLTCIQTLWEPVLVGGFNPFEKILVKLDHFPK